HLEEVAGRRGVEESVVAFEGHQLQTGILEGLFDPLVSLVDRLAGMEVYVRKIHRAASTSEESRPPAQASPAGRAPPPCGLLPRRAFDLPSIRRRHDRLLVFDRFAHAFGMSLPAVARTGQGF